jgi:hypothetical protein
MKPVVEFRVARLLLLTLVPLLAAASGCRAPSPPVQFGEVPDYMMTDYNLDRPAPPRAAMVDLQILGARPGSERTALVKGTRKALGPASAAFPEQEKMRYAEKLTDRVLAGDKVTLHLPADMASSMARQLEEAGLIARVSK